MLDASVATILFMLNWFGSGEKEFTRFILSLSIFIFRKNTQYLMSSKNVSRLMTFLVFLFIKICRSDSFSFQKWFSDIRFGCVFLKIKFPRDFQCKCSFCCWVSRLNSFNPVRSYQLFESCSLNRPSPCCVSNKLFSLHHKFSW